MTMDIWGILGLIGFLQTVAAEDNSTTAAPTTVPPTVSPTVSPTVPPTEPSTVSPAVAPTVPPTLVSFVASKVPSICTDSSTYLKSPRECCPIPAIFKKEVFVECGYKNLSLAQEPTIARTVPTECQKTMCVLEKYNFTKDGDQIDKEKFANQIDQWANNHTEWKNAVEKVKDICINGDISGFPGSCDPSKVMLCATATLIENCPVWNDIKECKDVKEHLVKCLPMKSDKAMNLIKTL